MSTFSCTISPFCRSNEKKERKTFLPLTGTGSFAEHRVAGRMEEEDCPQNERQDRLHRQVGTFPGANPTTPNYNAGAVA
jgi:hypothetical protein